VVTTIAADMCCRTAEGELSRLVRGYGLVDSQPVTPRPANRSAHTVARPRQGRGAVLPVELLVVILKFPHDEFPARSPRTGFRPR